MQFMAPDALDCLGVLISASTHSRNSGITELNVQVDQNARRGLYLLWCLNNMDAISDGSPVHLIPMEVSWILHCTLRAISVEANELYQQAVARQKPVYKGAILLEAIRAVRHVQKSDQLPPLGPGLQGGMSWRLMVVLQHMTLTDRQALQQAEYQQILNPPHGLLYEFCRAIPVVQLTDESPLHDFPDIPSGGAALAGLVMSLLVTGRLQVLQECRSCGEYIHPQLPAIYNDLVVRVLEMFFPTQHWPYSRRSR